MSLHQLEPRRLADSPDDLFLALGAMVAGDVVDMKRSDRSVFGVTHLFVTQAFREMYDALLMARNLTQEIRSHDEAVYVVIELSDRPKHVWKMRVERSITA